MNSAVSSTRAKSRTVLDALVCHNYVDLLSWASEPLKQRVHFLRPEDGVNLNELLGLWDPQQSRRHGPSETCPTMEQIHEFLLLCNSNPSAETTFPVYQRQVEANLQQALVLLGQITPQEHLSVALEAEGSLGQEDPNWKYHGLILSQEYQLVAEGWRVMTEATRIMSPPASPLLLHGYPFGPSPIYGKEQEQMDDDDDDDDYWQQYGEPEASSPSVTEPPSAPLGFRSTTLSSVLEPEVDAEEEEYWRKYAELQEEQPPQPSSASKDSDQQSDEGDGDIMDSAYETYNSRSPPSSFGSTESRRILVAANLETRVEFSDNSTEIVPPNHIQVDDGLTCPVDPTTLSMLLNQLADTAITVRQDICFGRYYYGDEEDNDENRATADFFVEEEEDEEDDEEAEKSPEEFRPRTKDNDSNNMAAACCSRSVSFLGTQSLSTSTSQNQEPMRGDPHAKDYNEKGKSDCYPQENDASLLSPCQQSEPLHCPPTVATDRPVSSSSSTLSHIEDGIGMSQALDKSSKSLILSVSTTATTTLPNSATTLANITPLDSPPSRSPSCETMLEHPSACDFDSEKSGTVCSDRVRILGALKVLVSEASSFGLDQQDLLSMLEDCFSLK